MMTITRTLHLKLLCQVVKHVNEGGNYHEIQKKSLHTWLVMYQV